MNVKQVNNTSQFPHEIYYLYETTLFKENVKVIKINNLPSPTGESKNKNQDMSKYTAIKDRNKY